MHDRWTITRAEFDGWFDRFAPGWRSTVGGLLMIGGLAALSVVFTTTAQAAPVRYLIPAMAAFGVVWLVRAHRRVRRLHRSAARIWDEGGAVCPKCHETLGDAACAHGLTRADADEARGYWEAAARGDAFATNDALALLARRERPNGALGRPLAAWKRMRRWAAASVFDHQKPLWKRFVAALLGFGITMSAFMSVFEWAMRGITPTPLGVALTMLHYGLMFGGLMIGFVAWSGARAGRNHCTACGHLIADGHETRPCAECGADLAKPGAVGSGETHRDARTAAIAGAIGAGAFLAPFVLGTTLLAQLMPPKVLMLQYELGSESTRFGVTREMSSRRLDAATTVEFADLLIDTATNQSDSPLGHSSFVGGALLARMIGTDTACRALRASVTARIDAPDRVRAGKPFKATVVPVFGSDLFQLTHSTAVAWGGLETSPETRLETSPETTIPETSGQTQDKTNDKTNDEAKARSSTQTKDETSDETSDETDRAIGGKAIGASTRFFTEFDMNPAQSSPTRPEPVTVTLDAPGAWTLRVRVSIVLLPFGTQRKAPIFDAKGRLVPPDSAVATTEIVVEKAVIVE